MSALESNALTVCRVGAVLIKGGGGGHDFGGRGGYCPRVLVCGCGDGDGDGDGDDHDVHVLHLPWHGPLP